MTSGTGGTAASISSVTASGGAPSATWTVSVSTAGTTGTNAGSIGLNLTSIGSIADVAGNALSATLPVVGQAYTYDTTPPTVSSINRAGTSPTNAGPLTWTVTFSEPVSNVTTSNFGLVTSNVGGTAPSISSVTASGGAPSATWTVSVSTAGTTGTNAGSIGLNLTSIGSIADVAGNALSATLPVVGQAYTYDTTPPTVSSIDRAGTSPTNAGPLTWTVTFSEPVSNVVAARFTLVTSGTGGTAPSISSVTASGGAPSATWTVSVSTAGTTGTNAGSIGLNLTSIGSIADVAGNALSATLPVVGQAYTYDTTPPTVSSINRAGTEPDERRATDLDRHLLGARLERRRRPLHARDERDRRHAPSISSVTASGGAPSATWTVSVSTAGTTGANAGSIGLNLTSIGSIADVAGNALSATLPVVGQAYTYDTTPPTAADIQAANGAGGTAGRMGTGDVITYTFSEAMSATSILAGWSGASTSVNVTVTNAGANDTVTVVGVTLGTIATGGSYVTSTSTVTATMAMSGSTVPSLSAQNPSGMATVASSTMVWTPSASAKDVAGNAMSTTGAEPKPARRSRTSDAS